MTQELFRRAVPDARRAGRPGGISPARLIHQAQLDAKEAGPGAQRAAAALELARAEAEVGIRAEQIRLAMKSGQALKPRMAAEADIPGGRRRLVERGPRPRYSLEGKV